MNSTENPFFNLEDFNNVEFILEGTNSTSQIKIPGGPGSIQLIEILEDGLWVSLPPRCCAIGHTLFLNIITKKTIEGEDTPIENQMHVSGVVEELENQQARLKFRQYSTEQWAKMLKQISDAQDNVNQLIKRTRK